MGELFSQGLQLMREPQRQELGEQVPEDWGSRTS